MQLLSFTHIHVYVNVTLFVHKNIEQCIYSATCSICRIWTTYRYSVDGCEGDLRGHHDLSNHHCMWSIHNVQFVSKKSHIDLQCRVKLLKQVPSCQVIRSLTSLEHVWNNLTSVFLNIRRN